MHLLEVRDEFPACTSGDLRTNTTKVFGLTTCFDSVAHLDALTARFTLPCHRSSPPLSVVKSKISISRKPGTIASDGRHVKQETAFLARFFSEFYDFSVFSDDLAPKCRLDGLSDLTGKV